MTRLRIVALVAAAVAGSLLASVTVHAQGDVLTDAGYEALGWCESDNTPAIISADGRYRGEVQWLPATWRAAAVGAGLVEWASLDPTQAPREVQRVVAQSWWTATAPHTQWPHCWDDAVRAMGGHAECDHLRNVVFPCPAGSVEDGPPAPVPVFAG